VSKWFGAEVSGHFSTRFSLILVPKCLSALVPKCPVAEVSGSLVNTQAHYCCDIMSINCNMKNSEVLNILYIKTRVDIIHESQHGSYCQQLLQ